jgi:hypothetical protein
MVLAVPMWVVLLVSVVGASALMIATNSAPSYAEKDDACTGDKRKC